MFEPNEVGFEKATENVENFDYSIVDQETSEFLKNKERNINEVLKNHYTKLGSEFKEAQDKLTNGKYGCFEEWYTFLGFKRATVYRLIDRYNLILSERENEKVIEGMPLTLVREVVKKDVDPELREMALTGEIKTTKEYRQLAEQKKIAERIADEERKAREKTEQEKQQLEQEMQQFKDINDKLSEENQELKNKPVERVEVPVEKVPQELQDRLDKAERGLRQLEEVNKNLEKEKAELGEFDVRRKGIEREIEQLEKDKLEQEKLYTEIEVMTKMAEQEQSLTTLRKRFTRDVLRATDQLKQYKTKLEQLYKETGSVGGNARQVLENEAKFLEEMASMFRKMAEIEEYVDVKEYELIEGEVVGD